MNVNTDYVNDSNYTAYTNGTDGETVQSSESTITNPFEDDAIADYHFTTLSFDGQQKNNSKEYTQSASSPGLEAPDETVSDGPQPYGATEQGMVRKNYSSALTDALNASGTSKETSAKIFDYLMNPNSDVQLTEEEQTLAKQVNDQATSQTIKDSNLPSTWTMQATDAKSWTPNPIAPYDQDQQKEINAFYDQQLSDGVETYIANANPPLTDQEAANLRSAIKTGQPSDDIKKDYEAVTQTATENTQEKYGLPNTWSRTTTDTQSWTPVNLYSINPTSVAYAKTEGLLDNCDQLVDELQKTVQDQTSTLAADDPNRATGQILSDYLKAISDAIKKLKHQLQEIQIADANKSKETSKAKFSALADRREQNEAQFKKMLEAQEKQKTMKTVGLAMKIVGPIVAAIGVIVSVATLGIGSPIGIALLCLGIAMVAFSVADSMLNLTGKLGQAMNKWIDSFTPAGCSDVEKKLIKAAVITAICAPAIIFLAVLIVTGSGAGMAANVAAQTATQVAEQTAAQALRQAMVQLALQFILLMMMSTNTLPELAVEITKSTGVTDKETLMAVQMATMALMLVAALTVGMAAQPGGLSGMASAIKESLVDFGRSTATGFQDIATSIKNSALQTAKMFQDLSKMSADEALETVMQGIENTSKAALETVKRASSIVTESITDFGRGATSLNTGSFRQFLEDIKGLTSREKIMYIAGMVKPYTNSAQLAVGVAGGVAQGVIMVKVAKLLAEVGDIKSAEEILLGLIKMLEQLLKKLQSGMGNLADFIKDLQKFIATIYQAANQQGTQMANSILAQGA